MTDFYVAFYCGENHFDARLVEIFAFARGTSHATINAEAEYLKEECGAAFVEWEYSSKEEYRNFYGEAY